LSKKAILVLGIHRSGTSLLTKILTIIGATPPVGLIPFWISAIKNGRI
jgi:hypothetical protein